MSALWLYAVADGPPGELGTGLAGEPLTGFACGGLTVVAGEPRERPALTRAALEGHHRAVERLAESGRAILPFRFGESVADRVTLERRLGARAGELGKALELVAGCRQMTLRLYGEAACPPAAAAAGDVAASPGTHYLQARRRARERARSLPEIPELREALRPLLRAERVERHHAGRLLATVYDLIPVERTGVYLERVEAAAVERRVTVTGPWPPYAFAPVAG